LLTALLTPHFQAVDCAVNTNTYPSHLQQVMLPDLRQKTFSHSNRATTVSSPQEDAQICNLINLLRSFAERLA
jgi:hypothetical protein